LQDVIKYETFGVGFGDNLYKVLGRGEKLRVGVDDADERWGFGESGGIHNKQRYFALMLDYDFTFEFDELLLLVVFH